MGWSQQVGEGGKAGVAMQRTADIPLALHMLGIVRTTLKNRGAGLP